MQIVDYTAKIVDELHRTAQLIAEQEAEDLVDRILKSNKIFVAGAGRSGLMVQAFAMRMMQMGFDSHVVGETVTPNMEKDDMLIIGSGSGETRTLIPMAQKAKSLGGTVAAITIISDSSIGQMADIIVTLPGSPKDKAANQHITIQPMGALFEQTMLLFCDAVILRIMEKKGLDSSTMFSRHANLE